MEEDDYTGNGVLSNQLHYYNLAGHLIGSFDGTRTTYYLTDGLDSVLTSFSQSAIQGEQVYGPYGASRYQSGTITTARGYTGQVHDPVSGLDYYVARYYDPVLGQFLSIDSVQGNQQGMNPYQYVGNNPETHNDPSGHCWPLCTMLIGAVIGAAINVATTVVSNAVQGKPTSLGEVAQAAVVGAVSGAVSGLAGPEAGPLAKIAIGALSSGAGQLVGNAMAHKPLMDGVVQATVIGGVTGGLMEGAGALFKGAAKEAGSVENSLADFKSGSCGVALSFTPDTPVATAQGERPIGKLKTGEKVWAYNSQTKKMELEPIQHVWVNHDDDLVDLTLVTPAHQADGKTTQKREVIHTNAKHPFLTKEQGFLPVSQLKPGMHILEADGRYGVVAQVVLVPGAMWMYNLQVAQDHTYAVGLAQWIVHNCSFKTFAAKNRGIFTDNKEAKSAFNTINRAKANAPLWGEGREIDGSIFENRNLDLPRGRIYREWTVHTDETIPGIPSARGGSRIVLGNDRSIWFTRTHYGDWSGRAFYRLWWR